MLSTCGCGEKRKPVAPTRHGNQPAPNNLPVRGNGSERIANGSDATIWHVGTGQIGKRYSSAMDTSASGAGVSSGLRLTTLCPASWAGRTLWRTKRRYAKAAIRERTQLSAGNCAARQGRRAVELHIHPKSQPCIRRSSQRARRRRCRCLSHLLGAGRCSVARQHWPRHSLDRSSRRS